MAKACAADFFGKVAGVKSKIQTFLLDAVAQFVGNMARAFNLSFMRVNLVFNKAANG